MESIFYNLKKWQVVSMSVILILGLVSIYSDRQKRVPEGPTSVRITIPEGYDNQEIAELFDDRFRYFDREDFLRSAPQGYLFPDTYYVGLYMDTQRVIEFLKNNFENKISPLVSEIESSGHSLEEIILMASILEAEIIELDDRKIASGILWKRLQVGMPLQVDSAPETYERRGFPEAPLGNPGLDSIVAALRPTTSPYFYFLTDKAGKVYYADTFDNHKVNRAKYLNK